MGKFYLYRLDLVKDGYWMKSMKDFGGGLPLKVLQVGCGAFGVHLKRHLLQYVEDVVVTTDRDLSEFHLNSFDYIFIATNDSSLQSVTGFLKNSKAQLVHFSGFHYFKEALGLHPVASFNKKAEYNLHEVTFVADAEIDQNLKLLFPLRERVSPNEKQTYHNFMSVAANSLQLISHNLSKDFLSQTGVDPNLLRKIVIQSLKSEMEMGEASFSGPWIREEKDLQDKTVELQNSQSLKNLNELFKKEISIYKNKEVL